MVGISHAFHLQPDLVAGVACNTDAGRELIVKPAGVEALSLIDGNNDARLMQLLGRHDLGRMAS